MNAEEAGREIARLSKELERHNRLYYTDAVPEISDKEYDGLFRDLELLEAAHPELASPNSPTRRVGGEPIDGFEQRAHVIPMLSIDDVFSEEEMGEFFARLQKNLERESVDVTIEPKIDGVAVSLVYRKGELEYALTRGDGTRGDDITENVRTIGRLPLRLPDSAPELLEVRGEIYMPNEGFAEMNRERDEQGLQTFVNPRNAAAGALKLLDSREVARRPLDFLAHGLGQLEGRELTSVKEFHALVKEMGLPLNSPVWETDSLEGVIAAIRELDEKRHELPYGTDGAVVKVNLFEDQQQLGFTARAPKWSAAFKYPPEQKETVLQAITVQVGRTGTLTPVAELDPVFVSGTTVRRATLHNQDEIDRKDVRIGDTVLIEKAGEIIPAVVKVNLDKRPAGAEPYNLYETVGGKCPVCGSEIERADGFVAWKCVNFVCPAKAANQIKLFVSRKALDIDGVGTIVAEKLVERGMVNTVLDLFALDEEALGSMNLGTEESPRILGPKNAAKIVATAERARSAPLSRWIYALGIPQVGESAGRELARLHRDFQELFSSPILEELRTFKTGQKKEDHEDLAKYRIASEVGPTVAGAILDYAASDAGVAFLKRLEELGIHPQSDNYLPDMAAIAEGGGDDFPLAGKTFVVTGTLSQPRNDVKARIQDLGGKVAGAVSKNTDYLLAGEGGGSKRTKAESLGVTILSEEEFESLLPG